jgi:hypothetical protein
LIGSEKARDEEGDAPSSFASAGKGVVLGGRAFGIMAGLSNTFTW